MIKGPSLLFLLVAVSGCAMAPPTSLQQSSAFDGAQHKSDSGKIWTVRQLKEDYKNKTGSNLIVPGAISCQWDDFCYYNSYAKAHDDGIQSFNREEYERVIATNHKKVEECNSNPKCKQESEIDKNSQILNRAYATVLTENPYQQSEFDGAVRVMCRKAGEAQRGGVTEKQLLQNVDMIEGIDPHTRYQIKQVSQACWNLSYNGVPNGSSMIRFGY